MYQLVSVEVVVQLEVVEVVEVVEVLPVQLVLLILAGSLRQHGKNGRDN